jgi:hypothetical protein
MKKTESNNLKKFPWEGALFAIGTLIFGSMTADGLEGSALFSLWYDPLKEWRFPILVVVIILFLVCFWLLWKHRTQFQAVRSLFQEECTEPHDCLLIFLSSPFGRGKEVLFTDSPFAIKITDRNGERVLPAKGSLDEDIDCLEGLHWSWQQTLRGIKPHFKELKAVYLIGSQDSEEYPGSFPKLQYAGKLIHLYLPKVEIVHHVQPVDFENFNEMKKALHSGISALKQRGFREEDMIIDVTSGQKTTSIAGAAVTLYSKVTFQYVQTSKPHKVIKYDVEILSSASL